MTPILAFEIEGLPRMTNPSGRKSHWAIKAQEAKKWKGLVFSSLPRLTGSNYKMFPPLPKARLVLTRYSSVSPDPDGLVSGFKHVIDGLVEAGVLVNDKFTNIGMPEYKWEKAPKGKGKIRVEVFSAEEAK